MISLLNILIIEDYLLSTFPSVYIYINTLDFEDVSRVRRVWNNHPGWVMKMLHTDIYVYTYIYYLSNCCYTSEHHQILMFEDVAKLTRICIWIWKIHIHVNLTFGISSKWLPYSVWFPVIFPTNIKKNIRVDSWVCSIYIYMHMFSFIYYLSNFC